VTAYVSAPVPEGEPEAIARVQRALEHIMKARDATTQPVLRGQHPKTHACVRARLIVDENVPSDLAEGIFARPQTFSAWVRFSSSAIHPKPDYKRDAHGVALKVENVDGFRARSSTYSSGQAQDFLFVDDPVFFCRDALEYADFAEIIARCHGGPQLRTAARVTAFFVGTNRHTSHLGGLIGLVRVISRKVDNPLDIRYWSQTPYMLGTRPVKYSLKPIPAAPVDGVANDEADRLAEAIARTLQSRDARFELQAQRWIDERTTPVEDPTVRWDESITPFVKVATLRIPSQDSEAPTRYDRADDLSFTPWHCLNVHRPLGGINRVRQAAYETSARLRAERSGTPLQS